MPQAERIRALDWVGLLQGTLRFCASAPLRVAFAPRLRAPSASLTRGSLRSPLHLPTIPQLMKLYSKIYGSGNHCKLIVLHGLFGMGDNWATLARRWAEEEQIEVHLLDMPNHGRSYKTKHFDYETMAADVLEYLETNHLTPSNLLGHSMGGKTAMLLATLRPDVVERLIVVDIAPRYYPVHHTFIIEALRSLNLKTESRTDVEEQLAQKIAQPDIRMFLLKSLHRTPVGFEFRFNLDVIADKIEEVGRALPEYAVYQGPTLFIRGNRSDYIRDSDFPLISKHFPNSRVETVNDAGHWVHAEQPDKVFTLVAQFLAQ
ncbi:alpha/beta fold hydrolase [Thermaurantimonas aggregans]|uniref:alpha/beta fold hydrolase n=1 Tax=Thermaurantimonas aggregans TaxID=2173829 RepID=UPI0027D8B521|nr:alpha/beta fold hydrolase [Thermaurantimonas aggregans]